jgi:hypothetical protein
MAMTLLELSKCGWVKASHGTLEGKDGVSGSVSRAVVKRGTLLPRRHLESLLFLIRDKSEEQL